MKLHLLLTTLFAELLIPQTAFADVNLLTGSFTFKDDESVIPRIYNSRSVNSGLFGFGWCTPYEDRLQIEGENTLSLRSCGEETTTQFFKSSAQLRKPSSSFSEFVSGSERIVASGETYELYNKERLVKAFDRKGKLLKVVDERGKQSQVLYDKNGFIKEILTERTDSLRLKVDPRSGRAVEITGLRGAWTRLTFLDGALVSARQPNKVDFFSYDDLGNLVEIRSANKITKLSYDPADRVVSLKINSDCSETYSYERSAIQFRTKVSTNCRGINNKRLIDFHYSKSGSGEAQLTRVSTYSTRLPANQ